MNKEMSLYDLCAALWRAKIYILVGVILACFMAAIFLTTVTPRYKAVMIVAPADGYALGDYASTVQYDQFAALPFWRPKDQEGASTDFYRFMHTFRGPAAAAILMKDETVLSGIKKIHEKPISSGAALAQYLNKYVRIDPLGATPLRRISYYHSDAEFAANLLRKLHLVSDQMIRRDRRRQSQSRVEYLEKALQRTNNPDHRKGITNLLMQQEHVQMLANLDEPYAAIVVEPASPSPKTVWPNIVVVWVVAIFLGSFCGFVIWNMRCRS